MIELWWKMNKLQIDLLNYIFIKDIAMQIESEFKINKTGKQMQITKKWLEGKGACQEGMAFVEEKELIGLEGTEFVKKLMDYEQYGYANWLIVRIMDRKQCVKYAQFAADSAKKYAERADWAADCAASAAYWAAECAERAERAAECAASAAYWAAECAADWAKRADASAERADASAESADAYKKIINFGLNLLEGK